MDPLVVRRYRLRSRECNINKENFIRPTWRPTEHSVITLTRQQVHDTSNGPTESSCTFRDAKMRNGRSRLPDETMTHWHFIAALVHEGRAMLRYAFQLTTDLAGLIVRSV